MRNSFQHFFVLSGFVAVFFLAIFLAAGSASSNARAAETVSRTGERLLTIHDGTEDRGILTRATSLRQALKEANIPIDSSDLVEPDLDDTLVASIYDVNIYRARPVTVIDGAVQKRIMSAYRTPEQIVAHAGLTLQQEDETVLSQPVNLASEGVAMRLTITRATPFTLILYGKKIQAYTMEKSVGDMLKGKSITIGKDDTLSVDKTAEIVPNMVVEVWRDGTQTITEEVDVPFAVEKIRDMDRKTGYREVKTPGVPGKRSVTYEIVMKNGIEVSRKEIQSVTIKEPTSQVEIVGAQGCANDANANRLLGHRLMLEYGFGEDQWQYLDLLWTRESGWIECKANYAGSGAYGIPQALPGSKMGEGWQDDPEVQIRWGLGYIRARYGNPQGAYSHWQAKNWY